MRKPLFLTGLLRRSCLLTAEEFDCLKAGAEVLEQDAHGIKVLRLTNGNFLKLFRVKHRISSARLYSHARSFCRNAERLQVLNVPTVKIIELYAIEGSTVSGVLYQPLDGQILRDLTRGEAKLELFHAFGRFVAQLHDKGIFFRSLHLGNVVLVESGNFGLIDIADMSIRPWRLFCGERVRNFRHICRLEQDRMDVGLSGWKVFLGGYTSMGLKGRCARRIIGYGYEWFTRTGVLKKP